MKRFLDVKSKHKPYPKEINYNTLYIRNNIRKEFDEESKEEIYVYNESQFEGNEILEYLDKKQIENEQLVTDLELNQLMVEQAVTELDLKILELESK